MTKVHDPFSGGIKFGETPMPTQDSIRDLTAKIIAFGRQGGKTAGEVADEVVTALLEALPAKKEVQDQWSQNIGWNSYRDKVIKLLEGENNGHRTI